MNTKTTVSYNAICFVTATSASYVGARFLTNVNPKIAAVAAATISVVRMFTYPQVERFEIGRMRSCRQLTAGDIFKRRVPAIALALFSAAVVSTALFRVSIKISLLISTGVIFFTYIPGFITRLRIIINYIPHDEEKELNKVSKNYFCKSDNKNESNKLNHTKKPIEDRIAIPKIINESTFSPLHYVLPLC